MTVESTIHSNAIILLDLKNGDKFNINFQFLENEEFVKAFVKDKENNKIHLLLDVDYSVTIEDGTNGVYGTVTMLRDIADVSRICIYRDIPVTQDVVFDSQTVFAGTTEDALDKLTMISQDNQMIERSLHVSVDDVVNEGDLELPLASKGAGVVYRDEFGKFNVGSYAEEALALRQNPDEYPDDSFVLEKEARAGKYITFNDEGIVKMMPTLKNGDHVMKLGGGYLTTRNLYNVAYSGDYRDLSNKLSAGEGVIIDDQNVISANVASREVAGIVSVGDNINVDSTGKISVKQATTTTSGVVIVGDNITNEEGKISIGTASKTTKGVVQIGDGLTVNDGVISANEYIPGDGITIENQTISSYLADGGFREFTLPAERNWISVCYGNGKFVAIARGSAKGAYSTDGVEWHDMDMPAYREWYSVCYVAGKFVVVADNSDKGAYSTDGVSWTPMDMPERLAWNSVCYGKDKFVAVAFGSNKGAYSTDGVTWEEFTLPAERNWRCVCYGNGKFVAVAFGGSKGAYSADGVSWTPMDMPASRSWQSVCYGDGKFVAVAKGSTKGAYSEDGINWTEMTMSIVDIDWRCVCYGSGKFIAVSEYLSEGAYSTDGVTWGKFTLTSSIRWYSVCYGNGKFVAVAQDTDKGAYRRTTLTDLIDKIGE